MRRQPRLPMPPALELQECVAELMRGGHTDGIVCDVGMPVIHRGVRYNCRQARSSYNRTRTQNADWNSTFRWPALSKPCSYAVPAAPVPPPEGCFC